MGDFKKTTEFLFSLRNRGSKYGIERMRSFSEALDSPEKNFKSIHVAGTNGKGSVCAMLEAVYRDNGYKTGLFTSPHLIRLNERIQVNRCPIEDARLIEYTRTLKLIADKLSGGPASETYPSFFEFITAIAFQYFSDEKVDIALIETGLGGRLDASNILLPELSIITSIGMDHTDILGTSLEAIAREKAGIIKKGRPVLLGSLAKNTQAIMDETASKVMAPAYKLDERFQSEPLPKTNLASSYQEHNAGLALQATEILSQTFPIESAQALKAVDWGGRWQAIKLKDKTLILDASHNPEACLPLRENLTAILKTDKKKPIIITGILGVERAKSLMPILAEFARELHLVTPDQPRACEAQTLKESIPSEFKGAICPAKVSTLFSKNTCHIGDAGDTLVVSGSIYLIGEILTILEGLSPDPIGQDRIKPFSQS